MEEIKVTDIHEAMQSAQIASKDKPEHITATFRVDKLTKSIVDEICERHGTTMSAFLRECCKGLVKDYNAG